VPERRPGMTTKELIEAEIDRMSEEELDELYRFIKDFAHSRRSNTDQSIMAKLRKIQFDGPEDLAANHNLYSSGEKQKEPEHFIRKGQEAK
jgi:hypothetical protein